MSQIPDRKLVIQISRENDDIFRTIALHKLLDLLMIPDHQERDKQLLASSQPHSVTTTDEATLVHVISSFVDKRECWDDMLDQVHELLGFWPTAGWT